MGFIRTPFARLATLLLAASAPIAMPEMTLPSAKNLPRDNFRGRQMEREGARVMAADGTIYYEMADGRLERGDYQTGARRIRKQRKQAAFGIKPLTHRATQGAHGWGAPLFR